MEHSQAFRAKARSEQHVEVAIYDVVGADPLFGGGISARAVLDAIAPVKAGGSIEVRINSVGGIVIEGMAIYNDLVRKRAEGVKVVCRVDSLAGSIASVIAMAGRLEMAEHSFLMIHNPYAGADGDAEDLRNLASTLDAMRAQFIDIYAKKSGRGREFFDAMMSKGKDTYLTPTEAMLYGLCDEVIRDPDQRLAAAFDEKRLANAPAAVRALAMAVPREAPTEELTRPDLPAPTAEPTPSAPAAEVATDPPAPSAPVGDQPMSMTPEELQKMTDLEAQVTTLTAALDAEKGARAEAETAKASAEEALAKKAKASDDEDEDDDEEYAKASAVVAEAIELTGCKDLEKLPGALAAVAVRLSSAGSTKDVHAARVKRLISEGKLPPHLKAKAMQWTPTKLDGFLEMTGGEKFAPVGEESTPGDDDPAVIQARAAAAGSVFDESKIELTADELKACARMQLNPDTYLAQKRADAKRAHGQRPKAA